MLRLALAPLVAVFVFCEHKTASASTTAEAQTLSCLTEMNEARTAAGLPAFGEASDAAVFFCSFFYSVKETGETPEAKKLEGTFAYYAGKKDCKAAVQHWKDSFSLFNNEIPPKYKGLNDPEVYDSRAVSFVALYNPKANPIASCAFVTCTTADTYSAGRTSTSHSSPTLRRLQDENQNATAVICLTNPVALTAEEAPFTEDEWQKIVHSIVGTEEGNGVSPIRPSLALGFMIAIFVYGLL
ncbi:SAG family member [Eimeria necatrix]|uniref:SAG family member n=1 Tax=Eimeria necatrix TaxID=51315 RepID=U6MSR9_9EIME|nr:SAG family member [Eimeria necatrix]CDJ66133.1 SAG family member [Eimeria necatrix]